MGTICYIEQFETIHQYMIDQNKIDRPVLSDDQLAQLNTLT